jgi:alpha-ketoglutarate-dependent 2,4-dichlorophenoxyacetate dioxygenase
MSAEFWPVTENFAAEVGDVDLSQPLSAGDLAAIRAAFDRYAVLVFPGQKLSTGQHLDFARHFGPLETTIATHRTDARLRVVPEIADVSNLNEDNEVWDKNSRMRMFQLGNRLWHSDSTFKYVPAYASLLYGRSIPPVGGHTEFADMRAAYDALSDETKRRIDGLVCEHSIFTSRAKLGFTDFSAEERAKMPPVPQVTVRTIPQTGRKCLYLASHAGRVIGLPHEEGRVLIDDLMAHATQRQFVYTHRWRENDLVIWDNRQTLHRGTAFDDLRWKRDVQRATVEDVANSCAQAGIEVPLRAAG